jgi:pyruvyltransferase
MCEENLNIFYLKSKNFGDGVNNRFWELLTNKKIIYNINKEHYITTGSIMCLVKKNSIIFGTGFISRDGDLGGNLWKSNKNRIVNKPLKIISVRGPLSREKLIKKKINCPENYGDPLILLPCIYNKFINIEENIIGIIPHYIDNGSNLLKNMIQNFKNCNMKIKIIDILVGDNFEKLIDEINKCKYIISSSLHGVIMGLVYKKKTIFVEFSKNVIGDRFKFYDFFSSLDINYEYKALYNKEILENIIEIDYEKLNNLGCKMINICPFIEESRKNELQIIYNSIYK